MQAEASNRLRDIVRLEMAFDSAQLWELVPFAKTLGITLDAAEPDAVRAGDVIAVARPLHAGRTVIVVQTELRDDDGTLVAQVTQTQAVLAA